MSAGEHAFNVVGGVPTNYARHPVAVYGTIGVPRTFHCTHAFFSKLDACFQELWRCEPAQPRPSGRVGRRPRPRSPGPMARGGPSTSTPSSGPARRSSPATSRPTRTTTSASRRSCASTLGLCWTTITTPPTATTSTSTTVHVGFSRAHSRTLHAGGCYHIFGKRFRGNVDGSFGSGTQGALDEVSAELGVSTPLTVLANWNSFLDAVARRGMGVAAARLPADHQCTRR